MLSCTSGWENDMSYTGNKVIVLLDLIALMFDNLLLYFDIK